MNKTILSFIFSLILIFILCPSVSASYPEPFDYFTEGGFSKSGVTGSSEVLYDEDTDRIKYVHWCCKGVCMKNGYIQLMQNTTIDQAVTMDINVLVNGAEFNYVVILDDEEIFHYQAENRLKSTQTIKDVYVSEGEHTLIYKIWFNDWYTLCNEPPGTYGIVDYNITEVHEPSFFSQIESAFNWLFLWLSQFPWWLLLLILFIIAMIVKEAIDKGKRK